MRRFFAVLWITCVPLVLCAQKKTFTFNQIFQGDFPAVFSDLPDIQGWADDEHYIELRDSNNQRVPVLVHAVTGKTRPYIAKDTTKPFPSIEDAVNSTFSPDGKYLAYTRRNNLYVRELATGTERALTTDGSDVILNGFASWIYFEEILGRRSRYKAFWWSPDSKRIAFMRFDDREVPLFPIYVADGQHGYLEEQHYPKAGDKNPQVQVGIADVQADNLVWADFNAEDDQYFGQPYWTPAGELLVQWMNRDQDTLIIYNVNKADGKKTPLYKESQPTWITLDEENRFQFLKSNKGFILMSDKDGWHNLYLHDMKGKLTRQITSGNFWGTTILSVDEKAGFVYFRARKENSARFDVYRASLKGKDITRLSFGNFSHDDVEMSPSGKYFITVYSNLNTPPAMAVVDGKGKLIRNLGSSMGAEFNHYILPQTRLTAVRSSDGLFDLPVAITYPVNFDSTRKYPVWISVYGGPNAGTVFDRWKSSGGLQQWWAQEGVIQVSMDNRSSGHFGKKGMNYIFKQMGKWETEDYATCARWLVGQPWVDASRIGVTGGSFGGYLTCMALTYGADVFTHGIANYSVTDWRLYDTHYTERFMNTPQTNEEGYRSTSVMTYVNKYKGKLMIVHGTTDDNVHMQNSIQLINALQDRRKSFEMMLYPNQRHGITGSKSAHHMLETIRFIYENMLGKQMPSEFTR